MGHERFSGSMKLRLRRTVVEHAPQWAPHIDRIENDVARGIVEGLNESPCEVENDRALAAFTRFGNEFGKVVCRPVCARCGTTKAMFAAFLSAFGGFLVFHLVNRVAGGEIYATCPNGDETLLGGKRVVGWG